MVAQGEPPEITSTEFWNGPSAASFVASAAQLEALAAAVITMLGGQAAVQAALAVTWPAPTGAMSMLSNVPNMLWLATVAVLLQEAALGIAGTAEHFELMRMATTTPEQVFENQIEHAALQASNILGQNTPRIGANRAEYGTMWVTGVSNKNSYQLASLAGVQAIPPIPPPPPQAVPAAGLAGAASAGPESSPMDMLQSIAPTMMQPLQQAGQMLSGGGPMQSLMQLPQQAMGMMSKLGSFNSAGGGLGGGDWVTAVPAAGGPVTASLASAGGGAGGFGGGGGIGGMGSAAALRTPMSWSSGTVNANSVGSGGAAGESGPVSRFAEARAVTSGSAATTGMGGSGAMMGPMAAGAGAANGERRESSDDKGSVGAATLTATAGPFRSPDSLPTITGAGGVFYDSGGAPAREGAH
ncbi:PPE domain-containing protein [Mycobacterium sp. M1]|uniref:PPE domain-containing protein n=1 Tax=Mycolicibacter acidiphilus TaxID=2835306 RepID=A0ABS5RR50_9MYCO|nr:PPE domain-containing protein [Mycolicibacter acidiphilus]MBS9535986.1 PPE domain-containing protein [Mycolicibacter acidiphilus]